MQNIENELVIAKNLTNEEVKEIVNTSNEKKALALGETNPELFKEQLRAINEISDIIKNELIYGVDYGIIPKTGDKPTLYKSGAEKIALLYGIQFEYEILKQSVDEQTFEIFYHYKAKGFSRNTGQKVVEGEGICSSYEPAKKNSIPKLAHPLSIQNTIMKIAKKRALVDAMVSIGNLSKIFTQDLEDIAENKNALAQAIKENPLTKMEMFSLYSTVYSLLVPNWSEMKKSEKDAAKIYIKENQLLPKLLKSAEIDAENMMNFNKLQKEKLLDFLNNEGSEIKWQMPIQDETQ